MTSSSLFLGASRGRWILRFTLAANGFARPRWIEFPTVPRPSQTRSALPEESDCRTCPTPSSISHFSFSGVRPFFCQIEAAETAIWLTEVAPLAVAGKRILELLNRSNVDANLELDRIALS